MLSYGNLVDRTGPSLRMRRNSNQLVSRRSLLKTLGFAPFILRSAPLFERSFLFGQPIVQVSHTRFRSPTSASIPTTLSESPLADVLGLVTPGSDEYTTERYAVEIEARLKAWGDSLRKSVADHSVLTNLLSPAIEGSAFAVAKEEVVRTGYGLEVTRRLFRSDVVPGASGSSARFRNGWGQSPRSRPRSLRSMKSTNSPGLD